MTSAFSLLSAASAPGSTINEDAYGLWPTDAAPRAAWVLDGVTGINDRALLPGPSDAAWFVAQVQEVLPALLSTAPTMPITGLLGALVRALQHRQAVAWIDPCSADDRETPAASFTLARLLGDEIEIARLGDCLVLLESMDGAVTVLEHPVLRQIEAQTRRAILDLRSVGVTEPRQIRQRLMPDLRAQRRRRNQVDGYGVLAAEESCLSMIAVECRPLHALRRVLLASDGYYRLVDHYGAMSDMDLVRETSRQGADALIGQLRALEAEDPLGIRHPRLKISDDATALLIEVGETSGPVGFAADGSFKPF
ncbi:MAG TPA: protein phosphatase 2C domain-containing protein [Dongiaceae bacterium]